MALREVIYDPVGSWFDGTYRRGAYGGHGTHVHAAASDPRVVLALIRRALRMGLAVRENPLVDPVDPVHTKDSHHYRTFQGTFALPRWGYRGRLGEAVDVSGGTPEQRAAYFNWIVRRFGDGQVPAGGGRGGGGPRARAREYGNVARTLPPLGVPAAQLSYDRPLDVLAGLTPQRMAGFQMPALDARTASLAADLEALRQQLLAA